MLLPADRITIAEILLAIFLEPDEAMASTIFFGHLVWQRVQMP
jgi:hypothetical protein